MNKCLCLPVVGLILLAGCTNKAIYENAQIDQRWKCEREPLSQQAECREQVSKDYREYQREREALMDEEPE
ncbi:hypothetical protein [Gilvimarinus algae]|uniref:Lipoprotein n=1 Tax=Gilvimarinus algae TaxID=3058037 RepID=A0ABT8TJ40_9GAMM|nr:hypothetical protein [Gilvimarinus sp. SDUM040014]MDO3382347.1 hypothetical protein [Gilvimarinus sp. SDUM040014]